MRLPRVVCVGCDLVTVMMMGWGLYAAKCYADLTGGDLSELSDRTTPDSADSAAAETGGSQLEGSIGASSTDAATSSQEAQEGVEAVRPRPIWLDAWHEPHANLRGAMTQTMRLSDLAADGDSKLLVADADGALKVYRNTALLSESVLPEVCAAPD